MPLKTYQQNPLSQVKKSIAVLSGKGGVGKSTLSAQLALTFSRSGDACGLLDADLYGPSMRHMLREEKPPQVVDQGVVPALSRGIKFVSMAHFHPPSEGAMVRAPIANALINRFCGSVLWGELDWLIVDFPPGTADVGLSLLQKISFTGAVVVSTPQEIALIDVTRTLDMLRKMETPVLGVVENMSYYHDSTTDKKKFPFGKDGAKRLAQERGIPFLGEIPLDPLLCQQCDTGQMVSSAPFERIARNIRGHTKREQERPTLLQSTGTILSIAWSDGTKTDIPYCAIQKSCPCASCLQQGAKVDQQVTVNTTTPVGSYALAFKFSTGCSHGIYPFEHLKKIGRAHA